MTRPQFIRWANRREKAADALREAQRLMAEMMKIDVTDEAAFEVLSASSDASRAIYRLARALDKATEPAARPPQDEP